MKNIGKPCAGKPHARFDEGGQATACSLLYPAFDRRFFADATWLILLVSPVGLFVGAALNTAAWPVYS